MVLLLLLLNRLQLTEESGRTHSAESTIGKSLGSTLGGIDTVGKGELNSLLCELSTVGPLKLTSTKGSSTDDLDGTRTTTVTSSHLVVKLRHSSGELQVTVLAVHVVGSGTRVVTEPDSVVLDSTGVLLDKLDAVKNLTSGLLHLTELTHEVPELGLGSDRVGSEDNHAVSLGVGVLVSASLTADNLVLAHFSCSSHDYLYLRMMNKDVSSDACK